MEELKRLQQQIDRREFLTKTSLGLGVMALNSLLGNSSMLQNTAPALSNGIGGLPGFPHFQPKAKRIVYLFMSGGPSQIDLYLSLIHI